MKKLYAQKDSMPMIQLIIKFMIWWCIVYGIVFRHGHDDAEIKELIMLKYYIEASSSWGLGNLASRI